MFTSLREFCAQCTYAMLTKHEKNSRVYGESLTINCFNQYKTLGMQKIRLNFGIGRRDRASKIVTTMLEAFENVPHNCKATACARVKLDFAQIIFENSKTFRLSTCVCCMLMLQCFSQVIQFTYTCHVFAQPTSSFLAGFIKIYDMTWSRNLF